MTSTISPEAADAPLSLERPPRHGWALGVISLAQLMVVLDISIANIALPFIGADLGMDDANLTWIVTAYALAFGGLLLVGGRLADLWGRRRVFMLGLTVFAAASLLGGLAQNEELLLGARALQGLGAALASPAGLALITTTFSAGAERNRAFAVYSAMSAAGGAVGLVLGGWLTGLDPVLGLEGWRWTFLINVPIGILAVSLAPRVLAESESGEGRLDIPGAITGTLGLLGLVYGFSRAGEASHGWGDSWTIASLAAGVALLVAFAAVESRVRHPLLPVRVFANRSRSVSFAAMMFLPAAMFAMFYFLSLFLQLVVGFGPLRTGLAFVPFTVGAVVAAALATSLISRVDARWIVGAGSALAAAGMLALSRISVPTGVQDVLGAGADARLGQDVSYWTEILPFMLLIALGLGVSFVVLTQTAVHHLHPDDAGVGSGVLNTMQQVGGALGLSLLGTVAVHFADGTRSDLTRELAAQGTPSDAIAALAFVGSFTEGASATFVVGAALIAAASLAAFVLLGVKHQELATDGPGGVHVG